MKVYVVELDDTESHSPIAVFSTRGKAENFLRTRQDQWGNRHNEMVRQQRAAGKDKHWLHEWNGEYDYTSRVHGGRDRR